jgi:glyoxylase-like metal-dependent hydrolase (beta-lactamase superfamily II)/8-oxo-dGTP pyrophosphatase MutT (NUDIX family)
MNTSSPQSKPPAPSATLIVMRETAGVMEVLLLRRAERGHDRNSGAWVFPGGKLDASDRQLHAYCELLNDAEASRRLHLPEGGLDYYVAAIRESFEEAGLLFANTHEQRDVSPAQLTEWRAQLLGGDHTLASLCQATGLRLAVDQLFYFSHWLTPLAIAKRFDARFFLTTAPLNQVVTPDGAEMIEHTWVSPAEVITRGSASFTLPNATRQTLMSLATFTDLASLLQWAREPRDVQMILPRIATGRDGRRSLLPHESAWAEVGRIDPHGHGNAHAELIPEQAVHLSSRVIRVTADNGSIMTGPGTNTYLVGGGEQNEWAVIDPGPPDATHVDAILAAAPGAIRWILVTHTHKDHSPAVALLKQKTNAVVYGQVAEYPEGQDASFIPDQVLRGGERISLPGDSTLRVLHTPGHASNHLCYLLEEEQTLFTGDHIMQASTVVINPPDGNMSAYITSLRALLDEDIEWLAPGHGFLMHDPRRVVEGIIQHRFKREAKVVAAMQALGAATIEALLARVYDDVDARLHKVALRSLCAHLYKLQDERVATERDGLWSLFSR